MTFKQMLEDELNAKGVAKLCVEAASVVLFTGLVIGSLYFMAAIQAANLAKGF